MKRDNSGIFKVFPADEAGLLNLFYNGVLDYAEKVRLDRHELTFAMSYVDGEIKWPVMRLALYFPDASAVFRMAFKDGYLIMPYGKMYSDIRVAIDEAIITINENISMGAKDDYEAMGDF